jgi:hypothetical protein
MAVRAQRVQRWSGFALVGIGLWLVHACSSASTGDGARSPSLDYTDPPRSANDGEPVGANRRDPSDTLAGSATSAHLAPGWVIEDGKLRYDPEHARARHAVKAPRTLGPDAGAPDVEQDTRGSK